MTKRGQAKLLDFGLAKVAQAASEHTATEATPNALMTSPGSTMGTVAYMSPEQVRAQELDARTDLFAFGAVLYEMGTGKMAFEGSSSGVIFEAILNRMPAPVSMLNPAIPAKLDELITKALEKDRDLRYQTAAELRGDLKRIKRDLDTSRSRSQSGSAPVVSSSGISEAGGITGAQASLAVPAPPRSWFRTLALAAITLVAGLAAGMFLLQRAPQPSFPVYRPLTFRRGIVLSARFALDGKTVIYSAAWEGKPLDLFTTRPESPQSQEMLPKGAQVLAISSAGEMLLSLGSRPRDAFLYSGTLARVPLVGGAPREILDNVEWADWSPDGTTLAVVHEVDGTCKRLEFPLVKVIYEADGWIGNLRVAPIGDLLAFIVHPQPRDDGGSSPLSLIWREKRKRSPAGWDSIQGLAWSPKGDEVWFSATRTGGDRSLFAVNLSGNVRLLARVPGELTVLDVSRDGTVLLTRGNDRAGMIGLAPGESKERDLSWLDWSVPASLSPDGSEILFSGSLWKEADQNMPSTSARPMALQRSASAKAAASPCRPMANGRWPG